MQTHCCIKEHLGTKETILNTLSGQKNTTKGKGQTRQWKDRELKHTKPHILERRKYFTTLFLKSMSQQEPVVTQKNYLNLYLNIYIY